jgi:hypothetical protein
MPPCSAALLPLAPRRSPLLLLAHWLLALGGWWLLLAARVAAGLAAGVIVHRSSDPSLIEAEEAGA